MPKKASKVSSKKLQTGVKAAASKESSNKKKILTDSVGACFKVVTHSL